MKRILLLTLLLILFTSIVSAQKPLPFKIEKKTFSIKINARKSNLSLKKPKNNNTTIIDGYTTFLYNDGSKYMGELKGGIPNGYGILIEPNGSRFMGEFKNGKENGFGIYIDSAKCQYLGMYTNGKLNGNATIIDSEGSKYIGEVKNDSMNGHGLLVVSLDSERFFCDGKFKDNMPIDCNCKTEDGYKMEIKNNLISIFFENNKKVVINFDPKDSISYLKEGAFYDSKGLVFNFLKKENKTILTYYNGNRYVGDAVGYTPEGYGSFYFINGDRYEGEFKDGLFNGIGTFYGIEGSKYLGHFKDDMYHGRGTYTSPSKINYIGIWENDNLNGVHYTKLK